MTIVEITKKLEKIKDCRWDDETAHGLEDNLMRDFIEYIGDLGIPDVSEKAKLVLQSTEIDFHRWRS